MDFQHNGGTMKRRSVLCGAGLAALAAALLPAVFHAQPGSPQPGAPAPQRPRDIRRAADLLHEARYELESVKGDFQGHRAKAIDHVNLALQECAKALEVGP
jgi:hypothetical protein